MSTGRKDVVAKVCVFRNRLYGGWNRALSRVECRSQVTEMKPQASSSHCGFVLEFARRAVPF